jgi:N-methylhydantoinase B
VRGGYYLVDAVGNWRRLADKAANVACSAGDRFVVETSGGGGVGDPTSRPEAEVLNDVMSGVVTADGAAAYRGVPIT